MEGKMPTTVSYSGAAASILSSLTLTEWGIVVGIITAIATFAFNIYYQMRRDSREQAQFEESMQRLKGGRRPDACFECAGGENERG